jgi:hypothetical protein
MHAHALGHEEVARLLEQNLGQEGQTLASVNAPGAVAGHRERRHARRLEPRGFGGRVAPARQRPA